LLPALAVGSLRRAGNSKTLSEIGDSVSLMAMRCPT